MPKGKLGKATFLVTYVAKKLVTIHGESFSATPGDDLAFEVKSRLTNVESVMVVEQTGWKQDAPKRKSKK